MCVLQCYKKLNKPDSKRIYSIRKVSNIVISDQLFNLQNLTSQTAPFIIVLYSIVCICFNSYHVYAY